MKLLYKKFYKRLAASAYLLVALTACSQPQDTHMNWIAKFDFFDLYQTRVSDGYFNPGSAITIKHIAIPYENTIILAATKEERRFPNPTTLNSMIVLFASNDKGQSYQEIPTGEEDLKYVESKEDYTWIEAYTMRTGVKYYKAFLLDNTTFELKQVGEYVEADSVSYRKFDGKYIVKKDKSGSKLINLLDQQEAYAIPSYLQGDDILFYNTGDGKFMYMVDQRLEGYDVKTNTKTVIKQLSQQYDYFWYRKDNSYLLIKHQNPYKLELYDLDEHKKLELDKETRGFYRYKNFMCDYQDRFRIRYSYDYGTSWTTHKVRDFSIIQNIFGFYKDEFLVTEGVFFRGDSPESGGRVMVGEFVKP